MKRAKRSSWLLLIWLGLPLLVWGMLRLEPWREIVVALRGLGGWPVVALLGLNGMVLALFSLRWAWVIRLLGTPVRFVTVLAYRLAGFGLSYYTPGPQFGGEPLQILLLNRRQGIPWRTAIASVLLDKLFELLANFTFLVIGLVLVIMTGLGRGHLPGFAWALIPMILVMPGLHLAALWKGKTPLSDAASWLAQRISSKWTTQAVEHGREAERSISQLIRENPRALLGLAAVSALVWVFSIIEYAVLVHFLGAQVTILQVVVLLTAARLAFLLPVPGGLGTLEASQVLAFTALGLDPALGLAASLVIRARDMALGGVGLLIGALQTREPKVIQEVVNGDGAA
ncbi:MAG: flippase-like domain-containing protein [Anaerolineae bacterium]|nr:flippase-like domain-containing protein [Anaerolineae bacterium]